MKTDHTIDGFTVIISIINTICKRTQSCLPFVCIFLHIYIYIYINEMSSSYTGVILKSYIFSKLLNLSKSNSPKKTLVNANILIDLIYYSLFMTFNTYLSISSTALPFNFNFNFYEFIKKF